MEQSVVGLRGDIKRLRSNVETAKTACEREKLAKIEQQGKLIVERKNRRREHELNSRRCVFFFLFFNYYFMFVGSQQTNLRTRSQIMIVFIIYYYYLNSHLISSLFLLSFSYFPPPFLPRTNIIITHRVLQLERGNDSRNSSQGTNKLLTIGASSQRSAMEVELLKAQREESKMKDASLIELSVRFFFLNLIYF